MNKTQKVTLLFIGFCMVAVIAVIVFNLVMPKPEITPDDIDVSQRSIKEEVVTEEPEVKGKEYINVFFIGKNKNGEEVYKAVKRQYDKQIDGSNIKFAINQLIMGPNNEEKQLGVYSEIPQGVRVIGIQEYNDKIIVNLNSIFVNDGGTESLYKRLYQLIKTVNLNTSKPTYLYIDGQMADIVGGEGIMVTQPLTNNSLGN